MCIMLLSRPTTLIHKSLGMTGCDTRAMRSAGEWAGISWEARYSITGRNQLMYEVLSLTQLGSILQGSFLSTTSMAT